MSCMAKYSTFKANNIYKKAKISFIYIYICFVNVPYMYDSFSNPWVSRCRPYHVTINSFFATQTPVNLSLCQLNSDMTVPQQRSPTVMHVQYDSDK